MPLHEGPPTELQQPIDPNRLSHKTWFGVHTAAENISLEVHSVADAGKAHTLQSAPHTIEIPEGTKFEVTSGNNEYFLLQVAGKVHSITRGSLAALVVGKEVSAPTSTEEAPPSDSTPTEAAQ